jgi:HK97 family phage major capsid protein
MVMPALKDAEGRLELKRKELATIFAEAGPDIDLSKVRSVKGSTRDIVAHMQQLNAEMEKLGEEIDGFRSVEDMAGQLKTSPDIKGRTERGSEPGSGGPHYGGPRQSLGELFVKSQAYKGISGTSGPESTLDVELKALMSTTTGFDPEETRTGRIVDFPTRPIQVSDLIPQTTTTQSAVKYMEETTFTNNAAETAEAGQYPEAQLVFTERSSIVRKITTYLPVTDEQLEDEPQVRGLIDNRLMFMVRQRLDSQILVGDGVAPNLGGILTTVGIQTQAKGGDPTPDAVYKAIVKVEVVGQAAPNAVIFHPTNWQDVRLLRTADGIYIWGNPSDAGPERIWGLRVLKAQAITLGKALVGDFANYIELSTRRGIDVQVSNSHADFFINGKLAVRADTRVALVVYRPSAFTQVTGL